MNKTLSVVCNASKRSIRRFVITEKAPTKANTAFTFKTLLRHYAKCEMGVDPTVSQFEIGSATQLS